MTARFRICAFGLIILSALYGEPAATAMGAVRNNSAPVIQGQYAQDRVYTGDQTSNTVSVYDPATETLLGVIRLGDTGVKTLSPLYKGALLVHGMGYSPDHRIVVAVSIGSNSVTFIDTTTNLVRKVVYVGRAPHEAFFTPNGKECWVSVRGEDYIAVIDSATLKVMRKITVADGPGMTMFSPDGRYAYVVSSFTPEMDVVDTHRYRVIAKVPQISPFSPNLAVSTDGQQVWFCLKDTGKVQIVSGRPPFHTLGVLNTGPITNHVNLVDNALGHFAYVTIGGLDEVKVFSRTAPFPLVATIHTGSLPHAIWPSGDGKRVYVGLENGDGVQAIDALTNQVIATIHGGQSPQGMVYVPDAVPVGAMPAANLAPLGQSGNVFHLALVPAENGLPSARASVAVNELGLEDLLEAAVSGLTPKSAYDLALATSASPPYGRLQVLSHFMTNPSGSAIVQALGPLRALSSSNEPSAPREFLVIVPAGRSEQAPALNNPTPVLVEQTK